MPPPRVGLQIRLHYVTQFDRRQFLVVGTVATLGLLAGCGKKQPAKSVTSNVPGPNELNVALSTNDVVAGTEGRVTLVMRKGTVAYAPKELSVKIDTNGDSKFDTAVATKQYSDTAGGPPYAMFRYTFPKPGTYIAQVKTEAGTVTTAINAVATSATTVPKPGEAMIPFDSPTTTNARGVNPICTKKPQCDLHTETITAGLAKKRPMAVLFATPELCTSATCGPVLDVLLNVAKTNTTHEFLHQEIYTDETGAKTTPVVQAYRLTGEPVLFLSDENGKITERLDGLFSETELRELLS